MRIWLFMLLNIGSIQLFGQDITINPALQKKYLPAVIKNTFIGMSSDSLQKARSKYNPALLESYVELHNKKGIVDITYQVLNDGTLYECIIEYKDVAMAESVAKKLYGKPNNASESFPLEWKFPLADGLVLKCWVYKNRVCIADMRQFK